MLVLQKEHAFNISEYTRHKKLKKYLEPYKNYKASLEHSTNIDFFTYDVCFIIINHEDDIVFSIEENTFVLKKNESIILFSSIQKVQMILKSEINFTVLEFKAAKLAYFFPSYIDENNIGFSKNTGEDFNFLDINIESYNKTIDEVLLNKFEVIKTPFSILKLVDYLEENSGTYDIESVLLLVNVPRRVLDKAFRLYVGMSVKTYASIIKFKSKNILPQYVKTTIYKI